MKIRKIKKEFKMVLRPIRKNRSYKVAKRLRKLWGISPFSDTISYSQDIWQGKRFQPLLLTIRIGKKPPPQGIPFDQFAIFSTRKIK